MFRNNLNYTPSHFVELIESESENFVFVATKSDAESYLDFIRSAKNLLEEKEIYMLKEPLCEYKI